MSDSILLRDNRLEELKATALSRVKGRWKMTASEEQRFLAGYETRANGKEAKRSERRDDAFCMGYAAAVEDGDHEHVRLYGVERPNRGHPVEDTDADDMPWPA
jgi:hypothetical protein